jgi:hypothetical protein
MSKLNIGMTVNISMLMNVVYVAVISVTIATRWGVLRKTTTISIVAHLVSGGVLDGRELLAAAGPSHPFIAFN